MSLKKTILVLAFILLLFVGLIYLSVSSTEETFSTCKILDIKDIDVIDFRKHDSVLVAANILYEGNTIKEIFQGEQYRDVWSTPIKVPIAFLDTLKGGLTIIKEGGGQQTHSLKLANGQGNVYTLRSVSKNPEPLVPEFAETLGLENIIVDGISAQHPYAALVVAELAKSAEILSTRPELVFVPEQPILGSYNKKFGNRLFLLEFETEGKAGWTGLANATQLVDTEGLQELKLKHGDSVSIDERSLVRARLFDLLIGDWDRHAKQWGWVVENKGSTVKAIPLPCDRDNAFFKIEGIVPTIISNKNLLPDLQNFENDIDYLPGLIMDFDIYFLRPIEKEVFIEEAKNLQGLLTDQKIAKAFTVWPKAIYELDGDDIIAKIIERRSQLKEYALKFKEVLDEKAPLSEPLKGSKDLELPKAMLACFECKD